jgi:small subunit ribosomal protein S9
MIKKDQNLPKVHPHSASRKIDSEKENKAGKFFEGIGRRKTAIARVRIIAGYGRVTVNEKEIKQYFQSPNLEEVALSPLSTSKLADKFGISIKVSGGGLNAQSEAIRHGLARALVLISSDCKKKLHSLGFLTRDPRMVERKKYGLKKARRAPQWKKR